MIVDLVLSGAEVWDARRLERRSYGRGGGSGCGRNCAYDVGDGDGDGFSIGFGYGNGNGDGYDKIDDAINECELRRPYLQWSTP